MSATATPIDVVALVVEHLLASLWDSDVLYPPGADHFRRVYGDVVLPPGDPSVPNVFPLVTLHRFGRGTDANGRLDRPFLQVDVWSGDDRDEAVALVGAVREALANANLVGVHARGVVTGSFEVTGPQPLWDEPEGRLRYTWQVQVFAHP